MITLTGKLHNMNAFVRTIFGHVLLAGALSAAPAMAAPTNINVTLDWIVQGTHAPFFVAEKNGDYARENLAVKVDPGPGGTNICVNVAGGAYQFGLVDLPTMIKFDAQNPSTPLVAVYMYFDDSPLAIVSHKSAGIKTPADLNGKRIAGGPGITVHDTISVLFKAAHVTGVEPVWISVAPQLFGPMFKRNEVDGLGGFTNSQIPATLELGYKMEDLNVLKYSDFGANFYGLALVTTRKYAEDHPDVVRGLVKAVNEGVKQTIADPDKGLAVLAARDPMMNLPIEKIRLNIALGLIDTPSVRAHGLSSVTPERLHETIDAIMSAYNLGTPPAADTIYTDKFLPPVADRMLPPRS